MSVNFNAAFNAYSKAANITSDAAANSANETNGSGAAAFAKIIGNSAADAGTALRQAENTVAKSLVKQADITDVVVISAKDVGDAVNRYEVQAKYGSRLINVVAGSDSALSLSRGFISSKQFLESAVVTLDGSVIKPNYR